MYKKSSVNCSGCLKFDWRGNVKLPLTKHNGHVISKNEIKKKKMLEALKKECVESKNRTLRQVFDSVSLR